MKNHVQLITLLASMLSINVMAETRQLSLESTTSIELFSINAGAGDLHIHGEDVEQIQVQAIISDDLNEKDYELLLSQQGKQAKLVALLKDGVHSGKIDLEVVVPKHTQLKVTDGSGDTCIKTISNDIWLQDGSGDIGIFTVTGNISIKDSSGSIEVNTVTGNLDIADGSGDIHIVTVTGDTDIKDGSGDIVIDTVSGSITLDDGSGDIDVNNAGKVVVLDAGSGDTHFEQVRSLEFTE